MNWSSQDQEESDNEMFQMSSSRLQDDASRVRLLSFSEDEAEPSRARNQEREIPQLRFRSANAIFSRKEEERKFKLALISVLIIGIILIIIINIGLGIGLQGKNDSPPATTTSCTQDSSKAENTKHCDSTFPWQNYRLPDDVHPRQYSIFLHPNLTLSNYSGSVDIVISAKKSTNTIILHSENQALHHIVIYEGVVMATEAHTSSKTLDQKNAFALCPELGFVAIQLSESLTSDKEYTIHIDFSGNFTDSLLGFYPSKYKTESGENRTIATTQFESLSARAAFPCFDEPAFKANFSLTMIREPQQSVLFNMPIEETSDLEGGLKKDVFQTSVVMSTYLVAFIVSDFANVTKSLQLKDGPVQISVYAPTDKIKNADFALDVACKCLTYYEKVFQVPYPLPKLDLVAIPDFQAGAMENWGLVTYRETAILYDPNTASTYDQERVAIVIAHELAHQWFGNLVTMEWWNDLWLNEGFASFVEYFGLSKVLPDWDIMEEFNNEQTYSAMTTDESAFTHPISVTVENSIQINEVFDDISYSKGACIISMLINYLGEDLFFNGVADYLRTYAYQNSVNQNLIDAVASQAKDAQKHDNIIKMMKSWTTQSGFPVISVSQSTDEITVTQSRYLLSQPQDSCHKVENDDIWQIPLSYVTSLAPNPPQWQFLDSKKTTFTVTGNPTWIKFNFKRGGYYLINYSPELLEKLTKQIKSDHTVLSSSDRSGLLVDIVKAAKVGSLDYGKVLDLLTYIQKEEDYEPIFTAGQILIEIEAKFRLEFDTAAHENIKLFVRKLMSHLYKKYGWEGDESLLSHSEKKLRKMVVSVLCSYGEKDCTDKAFEKFKLWKSNNTAIPLDFKTTVYATGIKLGSLDDWDYMWKVYSTDLTIDASEKRKLLKALCLTTDETKILFLLDESLKGEIIRLQDTALVVTYLSCSRCGSYMSWKFVRDKWKDIIKVNPIGSFAVQRIISSLFDKFTDKCDIAGAEEFLSSNNLTHIRFVRRAMDSARVNVHWIQTYQPQIVQWLSENVHEI